MVENLPRSLVLSSRIIGKTVATRMPTFRLSFAIDDTKPTRLGPALQPRSPPSASSANIAVPPLVSIADEIENVPGHIIPTQKPQIEQPISDRAGIGESDTTKYAPIHTMQEIGINFFCEIRSPNLP